MLLVTKLTQGKNVWQINQFFSWKPSLSRKTKVGTKWLAATEEGDELKRVPVLPLPMPENTTPIGRKNFHAEQNKMYSSKSPAKQHLNPKKEPLPATWKICTSTTKTTRTHVHSSTISTTIFEPAGKYEPVHVETYSIRGQNICMAKKQKNRHVKKHNLHQDWHIRYLLANLTGPIREHYFWSNTLLDTGIKPLNTARTNTTQLLQIAATDKFRYRNETSLAS